MGEGQGGLVARYSTRGRRKPSPSGLQQRGSAVLLALAVCLLVTVAVQSLTMVVLCARGALADEERGRDFLEQSVEGLVVMAKSLERTWSAFDWEELDPVRLSGTEGLASGLEGGEDWVMEAQAVTREEGSGIIVTAWLERGRDGLDLPRAALVGRCVYCDPGRSATWLETSDTGWEGELPPTTTQQALAYVVESPLTLRIGADCALHTLDTVWGLGRGWRSALETGVGLDRRTKVVICGVGERVGLLEAVGDLDEDGPLLLVVIGGGLLDARGAGEVRGVLVADGGSILLDGTVLRGGLFATGDVDVGTTGTVVYDELVCGWARDRSLARTRLVPGSRREENE